MCTSVNPNTSQLGLTNYQSVVLTFDRVSYRANWYSLTIDTDPSYRFISQARENIRVWSVWAITTARLRLAILNAHTDLLLIFYLLLVKFSIARVRWIKTFLIKLAIFFSGTLVTVAFRRSRRLETTTLTLVNKEGTKRVHDLELSISECLVCKNVCGVLQLHVLRTSGGLKTSD